MKKHSGNTGRVLEHLQKFGSITSIDAFNLFGATRLSAIIYNLRDDGYNIESKDTVGVNRYGDKTIFSTYILHKETD